MNKMIKGAAVAGLGVALLLGGAGTLAVWNDSAESQAEKIQAGDLEVTAHPGNWTSSLSGAIGAEDIAQYRVIPGESITYSQQLDVVLVGDELKATLKVTGADVTEGSTFQPGDVMVSSELTNSEGEILPEDILTEKDSGVVNASVTFTFDAETTGRDSVNASYDFSKIGFLLEQQGAR